MESPLGRRDTRKRVRLRRWSLLAAGICLVILALLLRQPLARWYAQSASSGKAENPLTPAEQAFLVEWRGMDRQAESSMISIPFKVRCEQPDAEVEAIVIANTGTEIIRNFWLYRKDMPNFYSASTIVDSVTFGLRTEAEKVIALWDLFRKHYCNFYPADDAGFLCSPTTLLAVFGTGQCNYAASALRTLCQTAGCTTRSLGVELVEDGKTLIAHSALEARADDRWIYLDPDGHAAYRSSDGTWASARDLKADSSLVAAAPHAYYDPAVLARAFSEGKVTVHPQDGRDPGRSSRIRHLMRFDLPPGTTIEINPRRRERFYSQMRQYGPPPLYCNGTLTWELKAENVGKPDDGILLQDVAAQQKSGTLFLRPAGDGENRSMVIPIVSPYALLGARVEGAIEGGRTIGIYFLPFAKGFAAHERGWRLLGEASGEFSLAFDDRFAQRLLFGYALKLTVPRGSVPVRSLRILTDVQCAPKALPRLTSGDNTLILYTGRATSIRPTGDRKQSLTAFFDNGLHVGFRLSPAGAGLEPATRR